MAGGALTDCDNQLIADNGRFSAKAAGAHSPATTATNTKTRLLHIQHHRLFDLLALGRHIRQIRIPCQPNKP